jgi:hypothetical protein
MTAWCPLRSSRGASRGCGPGAPASHAAPVASTPNTATPASPLAGCLGCSTAARWHTLSCAPAPSPRRAGRWCDRAWPRWATPTPQPCGRWSARSPYRPRSTRECRRSCRRWRQRWRSWWGMARASGARRCCCARCAPCAPSSTRPRCTARCLCCSQPSSRHSCATWYSASGRGSLSRWQRPRRPRRAASASESRSARCGTPHGLAPASPLPSRTSGPSAAPTATWLHLRSRAGRTLSHRASPPRAASTATGHRCEPHRGLAPPRGGCAPLAARRLSRGCRTLDSRAAPAAARRHQPAQPHARLLAGGPAAGARCALLRQSALGAGIRSAPSAPPAPHLRPLCARYAPALNPPHPLCA